MPTPRTLPHKSASYLAAPLLGSLRLALLYGLLLSGSGSPNAQPYNSTLSLDLNKLKLCALAERTERKLFGGLSKGYKRFQTRHLGSRHARCQSFDRASSCRHPGSDGSGVDQLARGSFYQMGPMPEGTVGLKSLGSRIQAATWGDRSAPDHDVWKATPAGGWASMNKPSYRSHKQSPLCLVVRKKEGECFLGTYPHRNGWSVALEDEKERCRHHFTSHAGHRNIRLQVFFLENVSSLLAASYWTQKLI